MERMYDPMQETELMQKELEGIMSRAGLSSNGASSGAAARI